MSNPSAPPVRRVVLYGAGALGALLGAKLSRQLPVVLVGRAERMRAILEQGVRLGGHSSGTVPCGERLRTASGLGELDPLLGEGDLVCVTVKASQVEAAVADLPIPDPPHPAPGLPLFFLQNGTGFEQAAQRSARRGYDPRLAVSSLGATLVEPGFVEDWGGEVLLPATPAGTALVRALNAAGVQARQAADLESCRWKKIAFNCALNPLATLLDARNCETITDELKPLRAGLLREAVAVAQGLGIGLPPAQQMLEEFEVLAQASRNINSMLQDFRRGRPTETPFLNGALGRHGRSLGIPVPLNERVAEWMARLEATAGTAAGSRLRAEALKDLRSLAVQPLAQDRTAPLAVPKPGWPLQQTCQEDAR